MVSTAATKPFFVILTYQLLRFCNLCLYHIPGWVLCPFNVITWSGSEPFYQLPSLCRFCFASVVLVSFLFLCKASVPTPPWRIFMLICCWFIQKPNGRWLPAPKLRMGLLPEAVVSNLMNRDISDQDYDMLLQLDK